MEHTTRPLLLSNSLQLQVTQAPAEVRAQIAELTAPYSAGAGPIDAQSVYDMVVALCRLVEPYVDVSAAALEDAIIDSKFTDMPVLVSAVSGTNYRTPRGRPKGRKT